MPVLNPKPSPDEIYEGYIEICNAKLRKYPNTSLPDIIPICELYHILRKRFRGYKHKAFHELQENMHLSWDRWNGYTVILMSGHLSGVCTNYKKDRDTIHPYNGWKFIHMIPNKPLQEA